MNSRIPCALLVLSLALISVEALTFPRDTIESQKTGEVPAPALTNNDVIGEDFRVKRSPDPQHHNGGFRGQGGHYGGGGRGYGHNANQGGGGRGFEQNNHQGARAHTHGRYRRSPDPEPQHGGYDWGHHGHHGGHHHG